MLSNTVALAHSASDPSLNEALTKLFLASPAASLLKLTDARVPTSVDMGHY